MTADRADLAILGGGFSAVALLHHLALAAALGRIAKGTRVALVTAETGPLGPGLAYGRAKPHHLLNVRAQRVALDPADPDGFVTWGQAQGLPLSAQDFAPRQHYGAYVQATDEVALARL